MFERIFVVSFAIVYYIIKFFLPYDLTVLHYAPREIPIFFYACPFILIGIVLLIFKVKTLKKTLLFGFLFYLFSLLLVIQIIPVGYVIVSERYSYIPYIGLTFILGSIYVYIKENKKISVEKYRPYLMYLIIGGSFIFSYLSFDYIKRWQNSVILFADIVKSNPDNGYAYYNYAKVLNVNGDPDAALINHTKAIELDSTIAEAYFCRATIYFTKKNYEPAIKDYLKAEQLKPVYPENLNNLAFLYSEIGKMDESIEYYSKAIALTPTEYLLQRRATCYTIQKKYKEALADYKRTILLNPNLPEAYFNRGVCYYYTERQDSACIDWKKAALMGYATAKDYSEKYCKK
jgi:tetratricopeptide (TPR) repeat protein